MPVVTLDSSLLYLAEPVPSVCSGDYPQLCAVPALKTNLLQWQQERGGRRYVCTVVLYAMCINRNEAYILSLHGLGAKILSKSGHR